VEGVEQIAKEKACAMDALALSWCLSNPVVTSPIIGPRTMKQLEGNLKALEVVPLVSTFEYSIVLVMLSVPCAFACAWAFARRRIIARPRGQ